MSSTSPGRLLPAEARLVECVARGDALVLEPGADGNEVRADVLRSVLLALPLPEGTQSPLRNGPFRVSIRGARITGALGLEDARPAEGAAAPSLILEECEFPEPVVLAHSRLARLSLAGCRLPRLDARGLVLDGPLDLSRLGDADTGRCGDGDGVAAECWVDLRGARIAGAVRADAARLRAPPPAPDFDPRREPARYALDLGEARISGSIRSTNGSILDGGLNLKGASVRGDVWLQDAVALAGGGFALNAQTLDVAGAFVIRSTNVLPAAGCGEPVRARLEGCAWFRGAKLGGGLFIEGVEVAAGGDDRWAARSALVLSSARVGGDLRLTCSAGSEERGSEPFVTDGAILGDNLVVDGSLALSGARLSAGRGSVALSLDGATIQGNLRLDAFPGWRNGARHSLRFRARGELRMDGLAVGRDLALEEADLQGTELSGGLAVRHARIGGRVVCRPSTSVPITFEGSLVEADFELDKGESGDHLELIQRGNLSGVSLSGTTVKGTLSARRLTVRRVSEAGSHPYRFPVLARAIEDDEVAAVRLARLPFYPGWSLCELLVPTPQGPAVASLLWNHGSDAALVLDGSSAPIHSVNQAGGLDLGSERLAEAYIAFFCAHVWGTDGPFRIEEGPASLPGADGAAIEVPGVEVYRDGRSFRATAAVHYGAVLYRSSFEVARDGRVLMTGDTPIGTLAPAQVLDAPFRRPPDGTPADVRWPLPPALPSWEWHESSLEDWRPLLRRSLERQALPASRASPPRLTVDLRGASVGTLRDDHGAGWGRDVQLELGGLSVERVTSTARDEYRRRKRELEQEFRRLRETADPGRGPGFAARAVALLLVPVLLVAALAGLAYIGAVWIAASVAAVAGNARSRCVTSATGPPLNAASVVARWTHKPYPFPSTAAWRVRRLWLARQYADHRATGIEYTPEPYAQIAQAYRRQGRFHDARRLTSLRLTTERKVRTPWVWKPFLWLYWLAFDYGLSPRRAIATVVALILLGWAGVHFANENDLLVLETTASATVAVEREDGTRGVTTLVPGALIAPSATARPALPCADAISPLLYAADVFIPLLDLRQEFRCRVGRVREAEAGAPAAAADAEASVATMGIAIRERVQATLDSPQVWLVFKAVYSLLGWIVISLTVLTISGVLRRQAEA